MNEKRNELSRKFRAPLPPSLYDYEVDLGYDWCWLRVVYVRYQIRGQRSLFDL